MRKFWLTPAPEEARSETDKSYPRNALEEIPMRKSITVFAVTLLAVGMMALPATADGSASTPSTNETNQSNDWSHFTVDDVGVGEVDITFNQPRWFLACFEYRIDGADTTDPRDNFNADIGDGLWPFLCLGNPTNQGDGFAESRTFQADEYVEIRMVFGAQTQERFDWTRVDVYQAGSLNPFTQGELDDNWEADRRFPTGGVESATSFGREDVAEISIDSEETASGGFQRTEGIKTSGVKKSFGDSVEVDLYLDPAWEENAVRAGLWVVGDDGDPSTVGTQSRDQSFAILDFINTDECADHGGCTSHPDNAPNEVFSGFRIWDSGDGWTEYLDTEFEYGTWVTLSITLDAGEGLYTYSIDGEVVGTATGGDTFIREVFLNSYNYGEDTFENLNSDSYEARWHIGVEAPPPSTGNGVGGGGGTPPGDDDPDVDPDAEPDVDELCPTFTDLTDSNTHFTDICALAIDEIVLGFDDGTYLPGNPVTRGQVASVIARTAGFELPEVTTASFTDTAGTTHEAAIEELATRGIITGFEDESFRPGDPVRRDQVASMIARWLEVEPLDDGPFTDVSGVHAGNINALNDRGVIMGTTATTFDPATNVQRDQFAALINRARNTLD